jgi:glyoxylase-like metal-dependent hydrolase (beta-lactamase superfamily II)
VISRREFNFVLMALCGAPAMGTQLGQSLRTWTQLPAWTPGEVDIHHIDTGRGNATFILAPDGTTILIDCGASNDGPESSAPVRPNASAAPGEWVARYALRASKVAGRTTLDYLIATHIHPDHVGDVPKGAVAHSPDEYVPTGVSQVDQLMPAKVVIDRSYPDYGRLTPPAAPFANNYRAWLGSRVKSGRRVKSSRSVLTNR